MHSLQARDRDGFSRSSVMICKFVGVYSGLWNELANLNHTRIVMFSSVLIDREVRKVAKLNSDELRDQDTRP